LAPPSILTQPQNQYVFTNGTPTFFVVAAGTPAPYYQWRKNGAAIPSAIGSSYTAPPVALSDNGAIFSLLLSNSAGILISSNAVLRVSATPTAPVIASSPQGQTASAGRSATFYVDAEGIPSPSYQWQTNGVNISGAAASSYTTWLLAGGDSGTSFRCVAVNSAGSVTSSPALLQVANPAPLLMNASVGNGLFQFALQGAPGRTYLIQSSSDLEQWNLLESISLSNTLVSVSFTVDTNLANNFYRAVLTP
jgi:hypothetical protein